MMSRLNPRIAVLFLAMFGVPALAQTQNPTHQATGGLLPYNPTASLQFAGSPSEQPVVEVPQDATNPAEAPTFTGSPINATEQPAESVSREKKGIQEYLFADYLHEPGNEDKYPSVRLTGFFHADAGLIGQDGPNRRLLGDIQDGAGFRRARLAAIGNAWQNVGYMVEMDFGFPGRPAFMDVFLDIHQLPILGNLRVGQWRQPFGMGALTSVRDLPFLERSLSFTFLPFRQIGVGFYDHSQNERLTWALSGFRFPTGPFGNNIGDDGGYSLSGRATFLPFYEEGGRLIHLGGNYAFLNPSNNLIRYAIQPEFFTNEVPASLAPIGVPTALPAFVDTGFIPAEHANHFGFELAGQWGQLYAQSEVMWATVQRTGGGSLTFPSAYVFFGYLLTGEVRPYDKQAGVFGRVEPLNSFGGGHGCGAWEIAARWSYIDLSQNDIQGGRLHDLTFGLNWYLNQYTKFQFNYIHAFLNRAPVGSSNADIIAFRAQVDF